MMSVAMSLNFHIAAVVASGFDSFWNIFSGISYPAVSEMIFSNLNLDAIVREFFMHHDEKKGLFSDPVALLGIKST